MTVAATAYLAHTDNGTYATGPWRRQGDTTTATHHFSNRTNAFMLSFGLMGYTRRRSPDHGLYWLANAGIGADRFRNIQDVSPLYTTRYHVDEVEFHPFAALGAGFGYTIPLRGADLACSLVDNWSVPFGDRYPNNPAFLEHHAAVLSLSYRWGL